MDRVSYKAQYKEEIYMVNDEKLILDVVEGIKNKKQKGPMIFHLTNLITLNDCANVTSALGGIFTTSFYEEEFEDILKFASAIVLNTAAMDEKQIEMAFKIGKIANSLNRPIVLAPVGITMSKLRGKLHEKLLKEIKFAVLRVAAMDLKTLLIMKGVDIGEVNYSEIELIKKVAEVYDSVIAITGEKDYIGNKDRVVEVQNGDDLLGKITGPGCMMTSLIGYFLGNGMDSFISAVSGIAIVDMAGELAADDFMGAGTFKMTLMDIISNLNEEIIKEDLKINAIS